MLFVHLAQANGRNAPALRLGLLAQSDQKKVHKPLRLIYLTAGLIALAETAVCMLQNAMFTQNMTDAGMTVTQNFVIESLPFLTYPMLSAVSSVLTILEFFAHFYRC